MAWGREAAGGVRVFAVVSDAVAPPTVESRVILIERQTAVGSGEAGSAPIPPPVAPEAAVSTVRPVAAAPPVVAAPPQTQPAVAADSAHGLADIDDEPVPTPRLVRTPRSLPMTRGECEDGIRPCPYVSCAYHLLWIGDDVHREVDEIYERVVVGDNGDGLLRALAALPETCALDVADQGEHTYDDVATHFGVTRARVQQIAIEATRRVRYSAEKRKLIDGLEGGGFHPEEPGNVWGSG